jgi:CRISPR-associated protein Csb1
MLNMSRSLALPRCVASGLVAANGTALGAHCSPPWGWLVALAEQDARGYALRSRCDLVCDGQAPLERVRVDGTTDPVELDRTAAQGLYAEAYDAARRSGFELARDPVRLVPQDKLVEIVRRSQRFALEGEGGEAEDGEA